MYLGIYMYNNIPGCMQKQLIKKEDMELKDRYKNYMKAIGRRKGIWKMM